MSFIFIINAVILGFVLIVSGETAWRFLARKASGMNKSHQPRLVRDGKQWKVAGQSL